MMEHNVGGVAIMTSEISSKLIDELERRRIAVTFLDHAPARGYVSTLRIDYASGIEQSVRVSLQETGTGASPSWRGGRSCGRTFCGWKHTKRCMLELGLKPGPMLHGDLRFEGGLAAGLAIAKMSPRPTAVMAVNDLTAVGVLKGLTKAGCRVPEDISLIGFDRTRLAEYSNPSITTVDIHRDLLGQMAADVLHELCSSPNPEGKQYEISGGTICGQFLRAGARGIALGRLAAFWKVLASNRCRREARAPKDGASPKGKIEVFAASVSGQDALGAAGISSRATLSEHISKSR